MIFAASAAALALSGCQNTAGKKDAGAETDKERSRRTAAETAFYAECGKLAEPGSDIAGKDGWYFSDDELMRLSRSTSTTSAVSAIADYAQQLRSQNIDLILVPVPPKALVYPDKIARGVKVPMKSKRPARLDSVFKEAMDALEAKRVKVVDLLPEFIAHREDKGGPVFPRTSATWSPYGVQLASKSIAGAVKESRAGGRGSVTGLSAEPVTLTFTGNLTGGSSKVRAEALPAVRVGRISEGKVRSLAFGSSGSSLMLMGGGDVLAWREANNPQGSSGAFCSLAEQIAVELQMIPDVLANSSDGRNSPRLRILRERTNGHSTLGGTRAVVWIVPMLDLAVSNWQRVPLQLQFSEGTPEIQLR